MSLDQLRRRLKGAMTALVTPFRNGEVDYPALTSLIDWQIGQGIEALVPCGTTGEAPTLTWEERIGVIRSCIERAAGRIPVIAGTGTNNTEATIAFTEAARAFGADAALVVVPYYNRPSQEGIARHFEAVAAKVDIPLIVYDVPSRTGVDLTPATIARLAAIPSVIGIKDATGDLSRPMALAAALGDRLLQFSGHDATAFGFNTMGGSGTISVVANVAPRLMVEMQGALRSGDIRTARVLNHRLRPLVSALELETNPAPVKHALHLSCGVSPDLRLPMVPVEGRTGEAIGRALAALDAGALADAAAFSRMRSPRFQAARNRP
ncbi:4-hydroxy-tetrahydrodipicolinate synthase [Mesorhizobium sp. 1B3]|uniref:4-hydroxy-tetrahydrodipicolinate synthase n=1 Tax=Mesorhizobium sp. 1B3 TaxID=3243599 RepID=UPI003D961540